MLKRSHCNGRVLCFQGKSRCRETLCAMNVTYPKQVIKTKQKYLEVRHLSHEFASEKLCKANCKKQKRFGMSYWRNVLLWQKWELYAEVNSGIMKHLLNSNSSNYRLFWPGEITEGEN